MMHPQQPSSTDCATPAIHSNDHSPDYKAAAMLDDSDATSLTTTSTHGTNSRTPSPFASDIPNINPNSLSMASSSSSPAGTATSSRDGLSTPYSMFSAFLSSTPLQRREHVVDDSPPSFGVTPLATGRSLSSSDNRMFVEHQGSWSDSDDYYVDNNSSSNHDQDHSMQDTPVRRGSPTWRIQQALFPEEETENLAPGFACKNTRKTRRTYNRSISDSPTECASNASSSTKEEPVRTRRSRRSVTAETCRPEHRRRNSTGGNKLKVLQQDGRCRKHSQQYYYTEEAPPNSHSKSKRWKKKQGRHSSRKMEHLSSTILEDRLAQSATTANAIQVEAATRTPPFSWRAVLCRVRLVTLVWGLVAVGVTSLGRAAMLATDSFDFGGRQSPRMHHPQVGPPTGGLRGSLLLATVGRQPSHSGSQDPPKSTTSKKEQTKDAKNKKKSDKKKEKETDKQKRNPQKTAKPKKEDKRKTTAPTSTVVKKDKKMTYNRVRKSPRVSFVARPPPLETTDYKLANAYRFELHDMSMFGSPTPSSSTHHRVVMLHDDFGKPNEKHGPVEQYPADFTDNTQFYGRLDSSDERLRKMELREPYVQGECVPMQDWQTNFHPSCNGVHELGVEYLGEESTETDVQLFGTKGYWRYAWRLDLRKQMKQSNGNNDEQTLFGDRVVLKTLKFRHDFEDAHFEHDRIDAVAMERLTSSPHVINAFGFCGHSVLTEYANGPRLGELADKSKSKPLARLRIARDIANGLADVHGIDNADGNNATFVHLDINPANVVSIGGTLKLNDFNIGIIRRWNTTSQEPCGFPAQYPNPQWRSPEEARNEKNLTEKVDVFSMGHIFFRLICGHEPWNKLEPGGRPSKEEVNAKVQQGQMPFVPDSVRKTTDPEVAAIRDAMLDCYRADPSDRPKSRDIAKRLEAVLEKLSTTKAVSPLLS